MEGKTLESVDHGLPLRLLHTCIVDWSFHLDRPFCLNKYPNERQPHGFERKFGRWPTVIIVPARTLHFTASIYYSEEVIVGPADESSDFKYHGRNARVMFQTSSWFHSMPKDGYLSTLYERKCSCNLPK